ncbi:uncharacterized protein LOC128994079 [Macrosteles quadrilineatus]|uniref:uncharacterized protein LOC128994079 n=1 Tax=Macrosteles quadrilineatus TaxID=74068 RepID=UPI0023E32702|nr:uncharacterized protein LOC128994079 [Macrosteles quadrilineatus]XP_054274292.1 uncharacterized protein LOC128994079 [Macrosteles quadrilineatus]
MADDEWQLEAVEKQFKVFESLKEPYKRISLTNLRTLMEEVSSIKNLHTKMNKTKHSTPSEISLQIINQQCEEEIKLSFIVIVTNMKQNGTLCKMPVFVLISNERTKYIDMNLTLFNSWDAFFNNNDLPPCQYCFPVNGLYNVGKKLKIDFASSPVALRQNVNVFWKCLGFVAGVGLVVASFFFTIPPVDRYTQKADSLLSIANEYVPGIRKYGIMFLKAVTLVQQLKSGKDDLIDILPQLFRFLTTVNDNFKEEISMIYGWIKDTLWKIYNWIKTKVSHFFEKASAWAQHKFLAVTHRVNSEVIAAELEAYEILEESRKNNQKFQTPVDATAIHATVNTEVGTIFRNAKTESALQNNMLKGNSDENIHPVTSDLLEISNKVANQLQKEGLKDVQDILEAYLGFVKDEFLKCINLYTKMLDAAKAGAGHAINVETFNLTLGIKGDVTAHYWAEAFKIISDTPRLGFLLQAEIKELEKQKKLLIFPIVKMTEDDTMGLYRCVGPDGKGKFAAKDLLLALEGIQIPIKNEKLVINETPSAVVIRQNELTIVASQKLNSDNTSEGMLMITSFDY